jgi:hypothetical protein
MKGKAPAEPRLSNRQTTKKLPFSIGIIQIFTHRSNCGAGFLAYSSTLDSLYATNKVTGTMSVKPERRTFFT